MFEFTNEEKRSIKFFVDWFRNNYKSDEIYNKIEKNKLTEDDLKALDK